MESGESKVYRMLRVLEYVGTQEFIEQHWRNRAVKGMGPTSYNSVGPAKGVIREAVIGELPELLVGDYGAGVQAEPTSDLSLHKSVAYNISEELHKLERILDLTNYPARGVIDNIRAELKKVGLA